MDVAATIPTEAEYDALAEKILAVHDELEALVDRLQEYREHEGLPGTMAPDAAQLGLLCSFEISVRTALECMASEADQLPPLLCAYDSWRIDAQFQREKAA